MPMTHSQKPTRLYFKSFMQMIRNSVGARSFRTFYVHTDEQGDFDALDDGSNSCAFFVSSILVLFKKLSGVHGTVASTIKDLGESGWVSVDAPQPGDVLVWEARQFDDGLREHIGFSLGDGRAISTSWTEKTPVEHDEHFGEDNRKILHIFRMEHWDEQ
jgi:hypothetical protein